MAKSADTNALLISGGGVAGIAAATAAIMAGHTNVIVVEKRDGATRKQKVVLSKDVIFASLELSGSSFYGATSLEGTKLQADMAELTNKFLAKLKPSKRIVSIQDFQIYQVEFLKIINIHGHCTILHNSEISSFTTKDEQNSARIKNASGLEREIPFDNLIVADGGHSKTLELLTQFVPPRRVLQENTHNAYGSGTFKAPEGFKILDGKFMTTTLADKDTARIIYKHIKESEASWTDKVMPLIYIQIDHETLEIYITGEVPESILSMDNTQKKDEVSGWFSRILSALYSREFTIGHLE